MVRHLGRAALCGLFLCAATGCVEMTQTITLNPDGKGKIQYDFRMAAFESVVSFPSGDNKKKSLTEQKREAVEKILTGNEFKKAAAWKDVSAEWLPDGRLHFVGTVYFERLSDLNADQKQSGSATYFSFEKFDLARSDDGTFKLVLHKDPAKSAVDPSDADPTKMSDKELDEYILERRVKYQAIKPLTTLMGKELKIKTIFRLPGEVRDVKGFKKESDKVVSRFLDGDALLHAMHKFMAEDDAVLKKKIKQARNMDELAPATTSRGRIPRRPPLPAAIR